MKGRLLPARLRYTRSKGIRLNRLMNAIRRIYFKP